MTVGTLDYFLIRMLGTDSRTIQEQLRVLSGRNLIRELEPGKWVRKVLDDKTGQGHFYYLFCICLMSENV